jgi:hypothetical protein
VVINGPVPGHGAVLDQAVLDQVVLDQVVLDQVVLDQEEGRERRGAVLAGRRGVPYGLAGLRGPADRAEPS